MSDHVPEIGKNTSHNLVNNTINKNKKINISVKRINNTVYIGLEAINSYIAMELFETIIRDVQKGSLQLDFKVAESNQL